MFCLAETIQGVPAPIVKAVKKFAPPERAEAHVDHVFKVQEVAGQLIGSG